LAELHEGITLAATKTWHAAPMLANDEVLLSEGKLVRNPANLAESIGTVVFATLGDVDNALAAAETDGATWAKSPVSERASCLNRMADLMENEAVNLMYLAIKEAGKTLPNAIAEVKEAVDFCRYYAAQITADWSIETPAPLGPVVCISPWNFPLAIFVGEVAAALAAGNVVLAKPAEQTSLIAAYAVELFYQAGVPRAALQFLPGLGFDPRSARERRDFYRLCRSGSTHQSNVGRTRGWTRSGVNCRNGRTKCHDSRQFGLARTSGDGCIEFGF
jgi:RHH-type proline utilization regulon transcriptional repressor/proline dehydrogenase/delta 1-pyrroline-5-carboxylate dehydrogenase